MQNYIPSQYTKPATFILSPLPGRKLWCVWAQSKEVARALVSSLLSLPYPPSFGVETWDEEEKVLIIIDEPQACLDAVGSAVGRAGLRVITSCCNYDLTGSWARGEKALGALQ